MFLPPSDMHALGVVPQGGASGDGGRWLGVVEALLRLADEIAMAAGDHGATHQAEAGAHPAGVQGEAKGHDLLFLVRSHGEPRSGHHATQRCGGAARVVQAPLSKTSHMIRNRH